MATLSTSSLKLGKKLAAHLLRRTTFGPSKKDIDLFAGKSPAEALQILIEAKVTPEPPRDKATGNSWLPSRKANNSNEGSLRLSVRCWWLDHMTRSPLSLSERMVYFYHTHFTTDQTKANFASGLYYQNALFRHYSLGNFKKLATKICYDNAMLMFLDGRYNRVGSPNENFAREFFELYTIGKGEQVGNQDYTNYTEKDIKEASRIFSGFLVDSTFQINIDSETGLPFGKIPVNAKNIPTLHDFGVKQFSERFENRQIAPLENSVEGMFNEIEDLVEMIFNQKATALHICRKLYRFFVYHHISAEVESAIINPLADLLIRNNYEIKPVLESLIISSHFFDHNIVAENEKIAGTLIKSPLELMVGMFRFYDISLPPNNNLEEFYGIYADLLDRLDNQGMTLYEIESAAGYAAYYQEPDYNRNWITAATLAQRYQFPSDLISGIKKKKVFSHELKLDVLKFVENPDNFTNPSKADILLRELLTSIFPREVKEDRFNYFLNEIFLEGLSLKAWEMEWQEYKSSGIDEGVRSQLNNLFTKIMQTPEYQLL